MKQNLALAKEKQAMNGVIITSGAPSKDVQASPTHGSGTGPVGASVAHRASSSKMVKL